MKSEKSAKFEKVLHQAIKSLVDRGLIDRKGLALAAGCDISTANYWVNGENQISGANLAALLHNLPAAPRLALLAAITGSEATERARDAADTFNGDVESLLHELLGEVVRLQGDVLPVERLHRQEASSSGVLEDLHPKIMQRLRVARDLIDAVGFVYDQRFEARTTRRSCRQPSTLRIAGGEGAQS